MTRQGLAWELERLFPGERFEVAYDAFEDLFSSGAADEFAKTRDCIIADRPAELEVWFVKIE